MIGDKWGLPYRLIHRNRFHGMYERGQIVPRYAFGNRSYLSLEMIDGQILKVGGDIEIRDTDSKNRFTFLIIEIKEHSNGEMVVIKCGGVVRGDYEYRNFCILKEDIACLRKIK